MRWTVRTLIFVLSLSTGVAVWYALTGILRTASHSRRLDKAVGYSVQSPSIKKMPAPTQLVHFAPVQDLHGYTHQKSVTLWESPEPKAPVVTTLKFRGYTWVEILGATRDYLHIKVEASHNSLTDGKGEKEFDGWAKWGSVIPEEYALILEANTGRVISRVPLHGAPTSISYSPDGTQAVFSLEESSFALEVRTTDYTITRSLVPADNAFMGPVFYGPKDGSLYAPVFIFPDTRRSGKPELKLIRVSDDDAVNTPTGISAQTGEFIISPDGLTGFILSSQKAHEEERTEGVINVGASQGQKRPMWLYSDKVDVIDLQSFKVRNSFILDNSNMPIDGHDFVLNKDGTRLYLNLPGDNPVPVIDTQTAKRIYEIPKRLTKSEWGYFGKGDLLGDSLFFRYFLEKDDLQPHVRQNAWLTRAGRTPVAGQIDYVTDAMGAAFGINQDATKLFRLNPDKSIRNVRRIEQRKHDGYAVGLSASPDGKRLIVFKMCGINHEGIMIC